MPHVDLARKSDVQLDVADLPRHVAVVMDGIRRWARQMGFDNANVGHRYCAEHLDEVLGWCAEVGIRHVTVFCASVDNVRKRASDEVDKLMKTIESVVAERLRCPRTSGGSTWRAGWMSCPTRRGMR